MTAQSQLEAYLADFRRRLKSLILARGAAIIVVAALLLTLAAVYFGTRRAFDADYMLLARLLLLLVVAGAGIALILFPLRALRRSRGIPDIERRAPDFDGRLETYDGLTHEPAAKRSPLLTLLAEDALNLARRIPVAVKLPSIEISAPAAIAIAAAAALLLFAAFGPDNWRYGVRDLWAGWLLDDTLPPQRIAVSPGDGTVRRGGDLTVEAHAEGFDPVAMQVFALFSEDGDWQSATMSRAGRDGFDFTFYALREPLRYYVAAAGIRSPEFGVDVVDLPQVERIRLSYGYPEWTRLDPRTEDPGNDIRAVEGSEVTVEVQTDRPLSSPSLVANGQVAAMQSDGNISTATLTVSEEGEYHIATRFGQEAVQLTDDYLISLIPDEDPVVNVVRPGRDWRASRIEEVTVAVEAGDDFGLERVALRYAVNGGDWQTAEIAADGTTASGREVLFLEALKQPVRPARARGGLGRQSVGLDDLLERAGLDRGAEQAEPADAGDAAAEEPPQPALRALEPGDVISYYAVAEDRGRSVQTDLFFVEVQPFDRSYSQASGGGGGGGGGQQQDEISRRQKEILVATWNLIREQDEEDSYLDEQRLNDNALMLAELQRTLAEQAQTLASRTRARQLTGADERIRSFVDNLELAAEAMGPAAERLADVDLGEAVPPEQEALQYLLRAEAVFTDIQVAFQQNGGAGGGLAGRDLSELFELEMDLEKNQYETEAPVSFEQQQENEIDEAIAKLQELARRQENLARQANRRNNLTEQERWRQEELRRETEELRRQLEAMQQRMAEQSAQQQGQQGQQDQQGQAGQSGQQAEPTGGQAGGQNARTAETIRQLDEALRAMNQAGAPGQDIDPERARRAIEQARRQLQQALEQMTAQRQAEAGEAFSNLAESAGELYDEQRRLAGDIEQAVQDAVGAQIDDRNPRGGIDRLQAQEFSQRKYDLQVELEALEKEIQRVAQAFRRQTPEASDALSDTLADLQQSQAIVRLGYASEMIRRGGANQVAATDNIVTSALRDLERGTQQALAIAEREAVAGERAEPDPNAELLAELRALRQQLGELTQSERQALDRGQGQAQSAGQAQTQAQSGQAGGGNDRFGGAGGLYNPNGPGVWDPLNAGPWRDPQTVERLREELTDAGRDLLVLGGRLRTEGLSDADLQAVRELADALRAGLTGNPELIEAEYRALLNLAEQLELRLQAGDGVEESTVRSEAPARVAQGFEESVADYYRRLSRSAP